MKIDEQQLAILEYLEREGEEMMPPARMISEKTGIDFGTTCDELTLLESRGLVFCVRLPGHPMRDGRFRLDDGGHALLAKKRKAARSVTTEVTVTQASIQTSSGTIDPRKVFVVHGRDHAFALAMSDFIRSLDLVPMEWSEAAALTGKGAPYLNEVLRAALSVAQSIVILLTPDNEARLRPALLAKGESDDEKEFRFHPRQNVVYEAGLAFGMAPDRTIIVKAGPVLIASDMQGLNYVAFDGDPGSRNRLAERLRVCGCKVQRSGEDWLRNGVFPTYADLLDKSPEAPAPKTKEASDHAFEVLPRLHLRLGSGMGGPDGHYITGFLKNVGRGVAYNPTLFLPGIGDVLLDTVIKKDEPLEQKIRYDNKDVFTNFLSDKTVRVGFEDELGNHYEQEGQVQQALTPGGTIVSYGVNGLDKPEPLGDGS
jgi:predicted nucleotide-binding protein